MNFKVRVHEIQEKRKISKRLTRIFKENIGKRGIESKILET